MESAGDTVFFEPFLPQIINSLNVTFLSKNVSLLPLGGKLMLWMKQFLYVFQAIFNCNLTYKGINNMNQLISNTSNDPMDINQAYRLAERVFYGDVLERSKAYVEASILSYEAKDKFLQMVGAKQYHDYLYHYLCIHTNREKLLPYCKSGLISGRNGDDFFIAFRLARCSTEFIDQALENGYIKPGMSFIEISIYLAKNQIFKSQRLTKKIKAENERLIFEARVSYLKNQYILEKSAA